VVALAIETDQGHSLFFWRRGQILGRSSAKDLLERAAKIAAQARSKLAAAVFVVTLPQAAGQHQLACWARPSGPSRRQRTGSRENAAKRPLKRLKLFNHKRVYCVLVVKPGGANMNHRYPHVALKDGNSGAKVVPPAVSAIHRGRRLLHHHFFSLNKG